MEYQRKILAMFASGKEVGCGWRCKGWGGMVSGGWDMKEWRVPWECGGVEGGGVEGGVGWCGGWDRRSGAYCGSVGMWRVAWDGVWRMGYEGVEGTMGVWEKVRLGMVCVQDKSIFATCLYLYLWFHCPSSSG